MITDINYKKYFEGKKITKQGFGFLGRGANVVKFLLGSGANVLVTDMKSEKDLAQSIREVEYFMNQNKISKDKITYVLGEHRLQDFGKIILKGGIYISGCDYVIQASGVPKDNVYLKYARDNNIKVYQESSLFVEIVREFNLVLTPNPFPKERGENHISIIGITGTRGKTTTTFLIKSIMDKYLENQNRKAYFGGNVQGVATLENLKYIKSGDIIVMELDSWILQGFKDIKYSPEVAIFTTFMADHMNYYKGDMQDYFLDKANIFLYQKVGDIFVTTDKIKENIDKYLSQEEFPNFENKIKKEGSIFIMSENSMQEIINNFKYNLLGEHNKVNVSLAVKACKQFILKENINLDEKEIQKIIQEVLSTFTGAPGRLELIKEINNIKYYNDTTATTPDAAIAALASLVPILSENKSQIILITGGRDKELDMTSYAEKIIQFKNENKIKKIILLNDDSTTGTKKLISLFEERNFVKSNYVCVTDLKSGVEAALRAASEKESNDSLDTGLNFNINTIILFSPAFASFGMFLNEYDRGEKFNEAVSIF